MMPIKKISNTGFTLIELMIASSLATVMSLAVLTIYTNQAGTLTSETQRNSTAQEAYRAFDIISRLIRQAESNSIKIKYSGVQNTNADTSPEVLNDAIEVDFTLPSNQDIWPNSNSAVTNNNAIRLRWDNKTISTNSAAYQILISNTTSIDGLNGIPMSAIAGSNNGSLPRIINFDLWPLSDQRSLQKNVNVAGDGVALNGYLLKITTRSAYPDITYTNPNVKTGAYINHRTYTVSGVVTPRNFAGL